MNLHRFRNFALLGLIAVVAVICGTYFLATPEHAVGLSVLALLALGSPSLGPVLGNVADLSSVYNPLTFGRRIQEAQTQLNRFLRSGVAVTDGAIATQIAQGGHLGEVTSFRPLTLAEPNYSTDDPDQKSSPKGIQSQLQKFRVAARNESWSAMNLARELALQDPVGAIVNRIGQYWATDDERRILNSYVGIMADNINDFSGDMVVDVATDDDSAVTDAERIGGERVIDALQTAGDHKESLTTLAIHSQVHARLQKQGLIDYIRDADNNIMFQTYMGKRLIVDDSLPVEMGSHRISYTCILYGQGIIGTANGRVQVPSEMDRIPNAGLGGGQDVIYSRVSNVWHPYGFSFLSESITGGLFANYTDLRNPANWTRVYERKNIPLAFIRVND